MGTNENFLSLDHMRYLASPYSHPDPTVRDQRCRAACAETAALLREGHTVFSPIVHSHPLVALGLPTDWNFGQRQDLEHLEQCDEVVVLMLDGWEVSVGVQAEIQHAESLGKPARAVGYELLEVVRARSPQSLAG